MKCKFSLKSKCVPTLLFRYAKYVAFPVYIEKYTQNNGFTASE